MSRIYVPSNGPADWQPLLAQPERHWKAGFSAMSLARSWEAADGMPPEIAKMFADIDDDAELLLGLPEHKVSLPGAKRGETQSDLFALVRGRTMTFAASIEGKVDEPFGPLVGEWLVNASPGKMERIRFISDLVGLSALPPDDVHYQLLHRTAAALIETARFKADAASMIVHSFSPTGRWFDAFARFAEMLGVPAKKGQLTEVLGADRPLYIGWATGDQRFTSPLSR